MAYDASVATSLQQLAALAIGSLDSLIVNGLPQPWGLVSTASAKGVQAYTAIGQLYGDGTTQIALALGAPWTAFLNAYSLTFPQLQPATLSSTIVSGISGSAAAAQQVDELLGSTRVMRRWALHMCETGLGSEKLRALAQLELPESVEAQDDDPTSPTFDSATQTLYLALRSSLWQAVQAAANLVQNVSQTDLLICGQGMGAALAQLAAYDLRPDKPNISLKFKQVRNYGFSAPALANSKFVSDFATSIPDAWRVSAGTSTVVDFFPVLPAGSWVGLGSAQALSATLPQVDAPWWERSGPYYGQVLAGSYSSITVSGASSGSASGYNASLAFTMAQLCAAADQRAQHPQLSPTLPSGWTLIEAIPDTLPWVSIFSRTSPKSYAIVFRSEVSAQETLSSLVDVGPATVAWLPGSTGLHAGAYDIYTNSLRDDLRSYLGGLDYTGGASVYLGGHSLGAMLAVTAAIDVDENPISGMPGASTYSFGIPATAGFSLEPQIGTALAGRIFLVNRPLDVVAQVNWNNFLTNYGTPIELDGETSFDGATSHSINTYIPLLDPQGATEQA